MSTFGNIPLAQIHHAPFNPRKQPTADDPKIVELSESIRSVGLIQPISVRKIGPLHYQLLAGARRFEAAKLAGLCDIDAMIHDLDDDEALKITITENLQRSDLTPLEEGRGIASLLESGRSVAEVSADIAKSETWVRRRAKLASLTESWQAAVDEPCGPLSYFSAAHLEVVAHLPAHVQDSVLDGIAGQDGITLSSLKGRIRAYSNYLHHAVFPIDFCDKCDTRSDREPDLFAGMDNSWEKENAGKAQCLNSECWDRQVLLFIDREARKITKKTGVQPVLVSECGEADDEKGIVSGYRVTQCEENAKGARPAMYVDGEEAGKMFWITDEKDSDDTKTPPEEPQSTIWQKRLNHQVEALHDWLTKADFCPLSLQSSHYLLSAVCVLGEYYCPVNTTEAIPWFKKLVDGPADALANAAWPKIKGKLNQLMPRSGSPQWLDEDDEATLAMVMEICGLDPQDFIDAAGKAFPDEKKSTKKGKVQK